MKIEILYIIKNKASEYYTGRYWDREAKWSDSANDAEKFYSLDEILKLSNNEGNFVLEDGQYSIETKLSVAEDDCVSKD